MKSDWLKVLGCVTNLGAVIVLTIALVAAAWTWWGLEGDINKAYANVMALEADPDYGDALTISGDSGIDFDRVLFSVDPLIEHAGHLALIQKWGEVGKVCEVFGHRWEEEHLGVANIAAVDSRGLCVVECDGWKRTCEICGRVEIRQLDWVPAEEEEA